MLLLVQVQYRQKYCTPQFNPIRVQTHDLQIMDSTFHAPLPPSFSHETLILTIELSGISLLMWSNIVKTNSLYGSFQCDGSSGVR